MKRPGSGRFAICLLMASVFAFAAADAPLFAPLFAQMAGQNPPGAVRTVAWERPITLVTYNPGRTSTVEFRGTDLLLFAQGSARVRMERGNAQIDARFNDLMPPPTLGPEYTCYVLWAVTSDGNLSNLGEVAMNNQRGEIKASVPLQAFAMFVTAEPYFAIGSPSNVVVMENARGSRTIGTMTTVTPRFDLVEKGEYMAADLEPFVWESRQPRDLFQARNALRVAQWQGADRYAPEVFEDAQRRLQQAELSQQRRGNNRRDVIQASRQAVQLAEGARIAALRAINEERLAMERAAAEAARLAAADEAERQIRLREDAEAAMLEAEAAKAEANSARLDAEAARLAAADEAERASLEADRARQMLEQAQAVMARLEAEKQELRSRLLDQFNKVLETRDTTRGLILNMGDVLFDVGKSELRFETREKLARLSGILLTQPDLYLEIEGHTDATGSDELNQRLSEERAGSVRAYLVAQGVAEESAVARGYGKTSPIADNDTAAGRQQNRRVEIVVSGAVLGDPGGEVR